jgi:3-hydroxyacyl-[acyl-carrier-protein] dehydratase
LYRQTHARCLCARTNLGAAGSADEAAAEERAGAAPGAGVPLLSKISDVRFRTPIYPGDTVVIEVKRQEVVAGFTMMRGAVKKADGTRVLNVDFTVAWKTPEGAQQAQQAQQ